MARLSKLLTSADFAQERVMSGSRPLRLGPRRARMEEPSYLNYIAVPLYPELDPD